MTALRLYERDLCPGVCGLPTEVAWHSDMDGYFEAHTDVVCHACSAIKGHEVAYHVGVANTRPKDKPLRLFELGVTVTSPTTRAKPTS